MRTNFARTLTGGSMDREFNIPRLMSERAALRQSVCGMARSTCRPRSGPRSASSFINRFCTGPTRARRRVSAVDNASGSTIEYCRVCLLRQPRWQEQAYNAGEW